MNHVTSLPLAPDHHEHSPLRRRWASRLNPWAPHILRNLVLGSAALASALATLYWQELASDRFVSEAHVVVQSTASGGVDPVALGGLLGGLASSAPNQADQHLLRDHLLSIDTALKLDARLHLRQHFADPAIDWWSRLDADASDDELVAYLQRRIFVSYDDGSGVLVIDAQAFAPHMAQAITTALLAEGEDFMNATAHRLAKAQVDFLEGEVARTTARTLKARQAVLAFQDQAGLIAPATTLGTIAGTISSLEASRASLDTQLGTLQAYLVPDHPNVVALRQQRDAITAEIAAQQARVAGPDGHPLNAVAERFARLTDEATFSQQLNQSTLAALEKGRIDAMQTVKLLSVVQAPNLPSDPGAPDRSGNALVFTIVAFLVAGVSLLAIAIVRDHID